MILTQFLDPFETKIFNKPRGGLKMKVNFFKSVTNHWKNLYSLGGYQPFLGGEFCLRGVATHWVWAGLPKKGLSPIIKGGHGLKNLFI